MIKQNETGEREQADEKASDLNALSFIVKPGFLSLSHVGVKPAFSFPLTQH